MRDRLAAILFATLAACQASETKEVVEPQKPTGEVVPTAATASAPPARPGPGATLRFKLGERSPASKKLVGDVKGVALLKAFPDRKVVSLLLASPGAATCTMLKTAAEMSDTDFAVFALLADDPPLAPGEHKLANDQLPIFENKLESQWDLPKDSRVQVDAVSSEGVIGKVRISVGIEGEFFAMRCPETGTGRGVW